MSRSLWCGLLFVCVAKAGEAFDVGAWRSGVAWMWGAVLIVGALEEATRPGGVLA